MKPINPNEKRGVTASGYKQESSRSGGHSSPSGAFSNRKNTASGVSNHPSRSGNESNVSSKFVDRRNGKEIKVVVDDGTGHCKK